MARTGKSGVNAPCTAAALSIPGRHHPARFNGQRGDEVKGHVFASSPLRHRQHPSAAHLATPQGLSAQDTPADRYSKQLSVNRSLHRIGGKALSRTPKSAKGRRQVALPTSVSILFRAHREEHRLQRAGFGPGPANGVGPMFTRVDGSPMLPDTVTHAWRKLARKTGFSGIRLHDARHTHATLLLRQGVHPKIVQERLGHATLATALDIYSDVLPGLQQAAALSFDTLVHGREADQEDVPVAAD